MTEPAPDAYDLVARLDNGDDVRLSTSPTEEEAQHCLATKSGDMTGENFLVDDKNLHRVVTSKIAQLLIVERNDPSPFTPSEQATIKRWREEGHK